MVQEVIRRCDYIDGDTACGNVIDGPSVPFSFGNKDYESDLCEKHETAFAKALEPFLASATPIGRFGRRNVTVTKTRSPQHNTQEIRQWLMENGRSVSPRGRIPQTMVDEYLAANGK